MDIEPATTNESSYLSLKNDRLNASIICSGSNNSSAMESGNNGEADYISSAQNSWQDQKKTRPIRQFRRFAPALRIQLWCRKCLPCCHPRNLDRLWWSFTDCVGCFIDYFILLLGPFLICAACAIIAALANSYFTIFRAWTGSWRPLHDCIVAYLLVNVIFNYAMCVCTRSSGSKGNRHPDLSTTASSLQRRRSKWRCFGCFTSSSSDNSNNCSSNGNNAFGRMVRELADATNYRYPESLREVAVSKENYQQLLSVRREGQRQRDQERKLRFIENARAGTAPFALPPSSPPRGWMLLGPREWGFCFNSNQPKPPRSHYDHVSKSLVLNLDHYCPWMFNTIGYTNYRYFCNFLCFVLQGMIYGLYLSWSPFWNMDGEQYRHQIIISSQKYGNVGSSPYASEIHNMIPWIPTPYQRTPIAFCFMICLSVGIAITGLLGFHVYLVLTAQTTIEFHANIRKRRQAKDRGVTFINPYDLGQKRNWQQVYGPSNPILAMIIPSLRDPEFLPLPMLEDNGCHQARQTMKKVENKNASSTISMSTPFGDDEGEAETLLVSNDSGHAGAQRRRHVHVTSEQDESKKRITNALVLSV